MILEAMNEITLDRLRREAKEKEWEKERKCKEITNWKGEGGTS
jgi:hypothetical protein